MGVLVRFLYTFPLAVSSTYLIINNIIAISEHQYFNKNKNYVSFYLSTDLDNLDPKTLSFVIEINKVISVQKLVRLCGIKT